MNPMLVVQEVNKIHPIGHSFLSIFRGRVRDGAVFPLESSPSRRRVFISRHVTFDEATLYDPPSTVPRSQGELSTVPQSQREVPHMLPTVTDSASSAPEITILPLPSSLEKV